MKFLFWLSLVCIAYVYAGYPFVLWLAANLKPRPVRKRKPVQEPLVTVIVAARNEEETIGKRVENLLSQNYPPSKLEVIVVSDGSKDRTEQIVEEYAAREKATILRGAQRSPRLRLVKLPQNRGKAAALNAGVSCASGEIIVFADARQNFDGNAVRELVANFEDPEVGSVTGELVFYENSDTEIRAEMGLYWAVEKWIRKTEGCVHSVPGATGAIYAVRKSLFEEIPEETILDDVYVPMKIVCRGYRNVFDGDAVAFDVFSKNLPEEKRRKIRTLCGNYQLLRIMPELAYPGSNPIFLQFFSHKIARLFVPFLVIALLVSAVLSRGWFYTLVFWCIVIAALLALLRKNLSKIPIIGALSAVSSTFFTLNYFAFLAFFVFIRRNKDQLW